jgi:hypothetical protein
MAKASINQYQDNCGKVDNNCLDIKHVYRDIYRYESSIDIEAYIIEIEKCTILTVIHPFKPGKYPRKMQDDHKHVHVSDKLC